MRGGPRGGGGGVCNSMEEVLRDNQDLANRLVDAALSGSIIGDGFATGSSPFSFDADQHRRRNARLAREVFCLSPPPLPPPLSPFFPPFGVCDRRKGGVQGANPLSFFHF